MSKTFSLNKPCLTIYEISTCIVILTLTSMYITVDYFFNNHYKYYYTRIAFITLISMISMSQGRKPLTHYTSMC